MTFGKLSLSLIKLLELLKSRPAVSTTMLFVLAPSCPDYWFLVIRLQQAQQGTHKSVQKSIVSRHL
jgi:hypothetical protein